MNDSSGQWIVRLPGHPETPISIGRLQMWARSGVIKQHTMVQEVATGHTYSAEQIPRVFSEKSFTTALLLSVFLGLHRFGNPQVADLWRLRDMVVGGPDFDRNA